jgi:Zn-dependent oligopeptidase
MQQHRLEVQAIADKSDAPTFDNTIVALERCRPSARTCR